MAGSMAVSDKGIAGRPEFPATSFSAVAHARDPGSPEHARGLERLIEQYWRPVYVVIRSRWINNLDDAKDVTQEFFATVVLGGSLLASYTPDRGSFRGLLRSALTNFMRNHVRDASRHKRGGGKTIVTIEFAEAAGEPAIVRGDRGAGTPEELFDAAWRELVLDRALAQLEAKLRADGRAAAFEAFSRYDLDLERKRLSYAELGQQVGLSADQVKHALVHARATYRDLVTEIVRGYVDGPEQLATELRYLFEG
jgi:RNA polymerase sigma factor (sigma-70 family)